MREGVERERYNAPGRDVTADVHVRVTEKREVTNELSLKYLDVHRLPRSGGGGGRKNKTKTHPPMLKFLQRSDRRWPCHYTESRLSMPVTSKQQTDKNHRNALLHRTNPTRPPSPLRLSYNNNNNDDDDNSNSLSLSSHPSRPQPKGLHCATKQQRQRTARTRRAAGKGYTAVQAVHLRLFDPPVQLPPPPPPPSIHSPPRPARVTLHSLSLKDRERGQPSASTS